MGHNRFSHLALVVLLCCHAYGLPLQQQPRGNDFIQGIMDFLTQPFVGIIDILGNLLKFMREKLRPNDKQGQQMLQQAQEMFNQAMDNALIKELQKLKPNEVIDRVKESSSDLHNAMQQSISQ